MRPLYGLLTLKYGICGKDRSSVSPVSRSFKVGMGESLIMREAMCLFIFSVILMLPRSTVVLYFWGLRGNFQRVMYQ